MRLLKLAAAAMVAIGITTSTAVAQHAVHISGNNITMTGCVAAPTAQLQMPFETLLWSRTGILTAGTGAAEAVVHADAQDLANRVVYWIDDDDDFTKHTGQMVEVRGKLKELEDGELEIDRDGDFTEIRLELGGENQKIRVPTAWLERTQAGRPARAGNRVEDMELKIATREVDVDDVKVLGPCPRR